MTAWLTREWVDTARAEVADLVGPTTLSGVLQVDVTGGVEGDSVVHVTFDVGRLVGAGAGPVDGPDAVVSLSDEDARAVVAGALDPSVAFMQGRMKVTGDMGLVVDLLALSATDEARARRARVAELTLD